MDRHVVILASPTARRLSMRLHRTLEVEFATPAMVVTGALLDALSRQALAAASHLIIIADSARPTCAHERDVAVFCDRGLPGKVILILLDGSAAAPSTSPRRVDHWIVVEDAAAGDVTQLAQIIARLLSLRRVCPDSPALSFRPSAEGDRVRRVPTETPLPRPGPAFLIRLTGRSKVVTASARSRLYRVWYGTNRKMLDDSDPKKGFGGELADKATYGVCEVAIPKSPGFGVVEDVWWRRWLTFNATSWQLRGFEVKGEDDFWGSVRAELRDCEAGKRDSLVYIHGYNVSFKEAARRAAQIGYDLKVPGITAFFSWPSKARFKSYVPDEASIEASEGAITQFLVDFARYSGAERVHLIAHSMGNRGLLRAMQRISAVRTGADTVKFGQVFLAAPDVDARLFRDLAAVYPPHTQRTTLYASPADKALAASHWLHAGPRAGYTPPVTIVNGLDTIEVQNLNIDFLGHGYYAEAEGLLYDMYDLMRHNAPPQERQRLEMRQSPDGDGYWIFRK